MRHDAESAPLHASTFGSNVHLVRILDHAILHAVQRVARLKHGVVNRRVLGRGNVRGLVLVQVLRDVHREYRAAGGIERRRAGDDAVEVFGVALRGDRAPGVRRRSSR